MVNSEFNDCNIHINNLSTTMNNEEQRVGTNKDIIPLAPTRDTPVEIELTDGREESEHTANYIFPILNFPHRKTFLERFGFRTYSEMRDCEKEGD